jgi:hypothetical protein
MHTTLPKERFSKSIGADMPAAVSDFITTVAPSLTGGLIALAGAITLFWLQQRSQRRERDVQRVEEAFEKFMSFCAYVARTIANPRDQHEPFNRWEVYDHGWRFTWTLPKQDRAVGEWAMAVVVGSIEAIGEAKRDPSKIREAEENMNLAITFLDRWKQGSLKTAWFEEQLAKHGFRDQTPPPLPTRDTHL